MKIKITTDFGFTETEEEWEEEIEEWTPEVEKAWYEEVLSGMIDQLSVSIELIEDEDEEDD